MLVVGFIMLGVPLMGPMYDPYGKNKDLMFHIEDGEKEKHILLFVSLGCGTSFFWFCFFTRQELIHLYLELYTPQ